MNYEILAQELIVALRGRRSRPSLSRHLGYKSNIVQRWETSECWPTASRFFNICRRLNIDLRRGLETFFRQRPAWLSTADLGTPEGVGHFLAELRGRTPILTLAERSGYNRYSIGRWLKGTADPKLPELLGLIDALSRRVIDFVAALVDPRKLPSVAAAFEQLQIARKAAYEMPLSHAVLRALDLGEYPNASTGSLEFLARKTGATEKEVSEALAVLLASGQAKKTGKTYRANALPMVDTGADPTRSRALKASWTRLALARMEAGSPGNFGYSVFAVSKRDLLRLREIQSAFIREMQAVIAGSSDTECVGLYCAQLLDLADRKDNAFTLQQTRCYRETMNLGIADARA